MRKLLLLAGIAALGFTSCEKVKDLAKIKLGAQSQDIEFVIPVMQQGGDQELAAANTQLNIDSVIKAYNSSFGVANIKSAKVKSVTFSVIDADQENNLAIVENCSVQLASDTKPEFVTIAEIIGNPDEYATSIEIPVKDVDLATYLTSNNYSYKVLAKTRRGTTKELNCKASISYELEVGAK